MPTHNEPISGLRFYPLTKRRWADFERLFGERGACGGCWCMWWRLTRSQFEQQKGNGNRKAMKAIVDAGEAPGILAYTNRRPIGWCAVAPRDRYPTLSRSRILKPIDGTPVWSVVCFFVERGYRNRGLTVHLLRAAADYVKRKGGRVLEGYPVEPKKKPMAPAFAFIGFSSAFREAGFVECLRPSETRRIMRLYIEG